jgi:excisionase family DNA binding protein
MTFNRFLITTDEAQMLTGIGRTQIYAALKSGELPSRIIGKRNRRILLCDLERYLGVTINIGAGRVSA